MNPDNCKLAEGLVSRSYVAQGAQGLARREKLIKALLSQRRMPAEGWDEATVEMFLADVALMDSNNFKDNVGVGEREARVACPAVARRHFRLAHGIGRSGDVAAEQPKAAGSSLLAKLTNLLVADAMRIAGMGDIGAVSVVPLATGMALTLTIMALRAKRPPGAKYVLWSRVDQKTCVKAVTSTGLELVPVPVRLVGDQLETDLEAMAAQVAALGADAVVCAISTTSCFAPRAADDVVGVAKLAAATGIGHIINNAYGVQAAAICRAVTAAWRRGRVDAVVQSTDKNFLVPVGGAVVAAGARDPSLVEAVNRSYPGRASMAPLLDVLMTLLHLGADGWAELLRAREELYLHARDAIAAAASSFGCRLLESPGNPISLAVSLAGLEEEAAAGGGGGPGISFLGSMLWSRCVSGTRVVARGKAQTVGGHSFQGYGASTDAYPCAYLTAAAAIGASTAEVDEFCARLVRCVKEFRSKRGSA
eukprot:jgi/Tetstr1/438689/TSEL_027239.t1